jgi:ribosomal protein L29
VSFSRDTSTSHLPLHIRSRQNGNVSSLPSMTHSANLSLQSNSKVKTHQLWGKSKEDLLQNLKNLRQELVQLRTQKITGGASAKLGRMYALVGNDSP